MALSGIFYGTTANPRLKPQISWSAVQSVSGNYSDVTAKLQYTRSNSGYTTGGTWSGSLTIGDETVEKTLYMEITYGNVTTVITHTARIYHDENGAKTITISATGGITKPAEASLKSTKISAQITLDTIPRASAVSATDCNVGACSTVVIGKKSNAFTSSLAYEFGELTGYLSSSGQPVAEEEKFTQTVVNFAVPESFYLQIPNAPTGICTLTCRTYQGQTPVGSSQTAFTVTASASLCAPEVSLEVADGNSQTVTLTGNPAVLVRNGSQAVCTLTATAKNGATIVKKQVAGQDCEENTVVLDAVLSGEIPYFVTDSRGYTTEKTYSAPTAPYVPLTVNATVKRESPTGDSAVLTLSGQCFAGSFGAVDNNLEITVSQPEIGLSQTISPALQEDNTYALTQTLTGFAYNQGYTLTVVAQDKLGRVEKALPLMAGVPVFDWGAGDFRFHVPVYLPKLFVGDKEIT